MEPKEIARRIAYADKFWAGAITFIQANTWDWVIQDDFPSWAVVKYLEGGNGTLPQLWVDYLRSTKGRSKGMRERRKAGADYTQIEEMPECPAPQTGDLDLLLSLTPAELAFLTPLLAEGLTFGDYAKRLGVSAGTVSNRIKDMRKKYTGL